MGARGHRGGRSRGNGGRNAKGKGGSGSSADASLAVARGKLKARKKADRARKLAQLKAEREAEEVVARKRTLAIRNWHKEERRREAEAKKLGTKVGEEGQDQTPESHGTTQKRRVSFSGTMLVTNIPSNHGGKLPRPVQSPLQPLNPRSSSDEDEASDTSSDDDPDFDPGAASFRSLLAHEENMELDTEEDSAASQAEQDSKKPEPSRSRSPSLAPGVRGSLRGGDAKETLKETNVQRPNDVGGDSSADDVPVAVVSVSNGEESRGGHGEVDNTKKERQGSRKRRRSEGDAGKSPENMEKERKKRRRRSLSPAPTPVAESEVPKSSERLSNTAISGKEHGSSSTRTASRGVKASSVAAVSRSGKKVKKSETSPGTDREVVNGINTAASGNDDGSDIDSLFAGKKKKSSSSPAQARSSTDEQLDAEGETGLLWGEPTGAGKKRYTKDGLRILSEDDIKAENKGIELTGDCPFDCACCF